MSSPGWSRRAVLGALGSSLLVRPALAGPTSSAGVALGLFASAPDWDYRPLLDEIVALGAPRILLVVPHYQDSVRAVKIGPRPGFSPDRSTVDRTLAAARNRGLQVALMPLVRLTRRTPTEWRGVIAPKDVDRWFRAWTAFVCDLGGLARAHRAGRLVVGTEFASLEVHRDRWAAHIRAVRDVFPGRLLYSANWDHHRDVPFWDLVDEIGITGYFRLCPPGSTLDAAGAARIWRDLLPRLHAFADGKGKPLVLTEIGWPALATAASHPWDDTYAAPPDPELPAELWRGFLQARESVGRESAFYAWNWFGVGAGETGFGLRGMPAAQVVKGAF